MKSLYPGICRKCGQRFPVGTSILYSRETGARHVKCPELKSMPAEKPAVPAVIKPLFPPIPDVPADEVISLFYSEGEYLSGYMPRSRSNELESLGLAHYVSGWGTHFDAMKDFKPVLGEKFTWAQAIAYVTPLREVAEKKHAAKVATKNQKENDAFAKAKETGQPVPLRTWSEECDGSEQECDIDNLTEYALPDGRKKVVRSHSY